jgi:Protein of unknown function (DUF3006)
MQVQLDSFEGNGTAVLLLYPEGRQCFDVARELLPEDARAEDVFEVGFGQAREEIRWMATENRWLLNKPLGRDDG